MTVRILPFGDRALLAEVADLGAMLSLHGRLAASRPAGVVDLVPAARTVLVAVDPAVLSLAAARAWIGDAAGAGGADVMGDAVGAGADPTGPLVELPIVYDGADLAETAGLVGLGTAELAARHAAAEWSVAFTGFAPGFGYLVSADWPFPVPRLDRPRSRVPAGAVGLAGPFTGAYPRSSPGGWRLIGTTSAVLFDPAAATPALLQPGTRVRFRPAPALPASAPALAAPYAPAAPSAPCTSLVMTLPLRTRLFSLATVRLTSLTAVGTSYATHNEPMIPLYIFYSMFGFQRTGDSFWAAADQMARGFIIGATAGRTTLTGEGLQHADGHSPLLAATNPGVVSYDPAFAYELAHIVDDGLRRMYGDKPENIYYYLTVYNEPINQPAQPENLDVAGVLKGMYLYQQAPSNKELYANILVSGVTMPDALKAAAILADDWGVGANVYSVTSWGELARDGIAFDRAAVREPGVTHPEPYLTEVLAQTVGPSIALGR
mgnify:CR=1 FL=1